jgi:hypothetical protein
MLDCHDELVEALEKQTCRQITNQTNEPDLKSLPNRGRFRGG